MDDGPRAPHQELVRTFRINSASNERGGIHMGRYLLLWLLGIPLPILMLIYAFGGLH